MDWVPCCEHCKCPPSKRDGHDDTCSQGCNDEEFARFENEGGYVVNKGKLKELLMYASPLPSQLKEYFKEFDGR